MLNRYVEFGAQNFDNLSTMFFVDKLDQKLIDIQTLVLCWQFTLNTQINWIGFWLAWEPNYAEPSTEKFWARNLTTYRLIFFGNKLGQAIEFW